MPSHGSDYLVLRCSVSMEPARYLGSAIIYDLELYISHKPNPIIEHRRTCEALARSELLFSKLDRTFEDLEYK